MTLNWTTTIEPEDNRLEITEYLFMTYNEWVDRLNVFMHGEVSELVKVRRNLRRDLQKCRKELNGLKRKALEYTREL
jgi:hypothetical protein